MKASGPSSLRGIELSCLRLQIPADIGRMTGRGLVYGAPPRAACDPKLPFERYCSTSALQRKRKSRFRTGPDPAQWLYSIARCRSPRTNSR